LLQNYSSDLVRGAVSNFDALAKTWVKRDAVNVHPEKLQLLLIKQTSISQSG
jgi:hypothetical protein